MLKVCKKPKEYDGKTLEETLDLTARLIGGPGYNLDLNQKVQTTIDVLKTSPINGCITGSSLLDADFTTWESAPDIDVFVYSDYDLIHAIDFVQNCLKLTPGKGSEKSEKQELWKLNKLRTSGVNYKFGITTFTFNHKDVLINLTFKLTKNKGRWIPISDAPSVLKTFDMSIVMKAYDIQSHIEFDMRVGEPKVAIPNPMRCDDPQLWNVKNWIRKFDRVVKYYDRGYDTRPMAEFYLKLIDDFMAQGSLFDSEAWTEMFNSAVVEFKEQKKVIKKWLKKTNKIKQDKKLRNIRKIKKLKKIRKLSKSSHLSFSSKL